MLVMAESRYRIERIIENDPVIKKGLQRGIVNSRALVRYLQEVEEIDSSPDAILGVIRRHPFPRSESIPAAHLFKDCKLALRNNLGDLSLEIDSEVMRRVVDFASSLRTSRGENLRVLVGMKSIRVIADQEAILQLKETLRDHTIIRWLTNLAEISVLLTREAEEGKGVIAKITTEIALNDISLLGTVCVAPEFIMLVSEKDATRAYEALHKMFSEESEPYESKQRSSVLNA